VYIKHNNYPHKTNSKKISLIKKLIAAYEMLFDAIWVHSGHFTKKSYEYIPHPIYEFQGETLSKSEEGEILEIMKKCNGKYFLLFGLIERYKNIDKLIDKVPKDISIVVCGYAPDDDYLNQIKGKSGSNIIIISKKVTDVFAKRLHENAIAALIIHNSQDMIVSGSFVFAVSCLTSIICTRTDFTEWYVGNHQNNNIEILNSIDLIEESLRIHLNDVIEINMCEILEVHKVELKSRIRASLLKLGSNG
jgi:glycosyltransferase involved in cell wall biosynthesis